MGVIPRWEAGAVTALNVKTAEEIEEERLLEEAERIKAELGKEIYLEKIMSLTVAFMSWFSSSSSMFLC